MNGELEQLLQDYLVGPTANKLLNLRTRIQDPLAERLTIISVDSAAVAFAIDKAISLFAATASPAKGWNWRIWITAHAMSILVESIGGTSWIEGLASTLSDGSALERRAMIFGAILTLDGRCQWLLLAIIWKPGLNSGSGECLAKLQRHLFSL